MKTGKWLGRFLVGSMLVLSAACGGGGGSGGNGSGPGGDGSNDSLPNKGMQGTLYFNKGGYGLASLNLTNPITGYYQPEIEGLGTIDPYTSTISADGAEFVVQFIDSEPGYYFYSGIGVFRTDGALVNSFYIGAKSYGFPFLSPDSQLLAVGLKPDSGFENDSITLGLRIFDRNGDLIREFLVDENGAYPSYWAWTHEGRLLISYEKLGLYIVDDVRGGQARFIKSFEGKTPFYLDVSPDDSQIAFTFHEKEQVFVMNIDGTEFRQLTVSREPAIDNTVVRGLSWAPDGRNIAIVAMSPFESLPCAGTELLIVKSEAIEAPLPVIKPYHTAIYPVKSDDLFYVQEYSDRENGGPLNVGSFCVDQPGIAWRG